jgi:hypothetical protein
MLYEILGVRQDDIELARRWFQDEYFDLFVWSGPDGQVSAFQLCYDRLKNERVLAWRKEGGFSHRRVDDGEARPGHKMSPLMVTDGRFFGYRIAREFERRGAELSPDLRDFLLLRISEAGKLLASPRRRR